MRSKPFILIFLISFLMVASSCSKPQDNSELINKYNVLVQDYNSLTQKNNDLLKQNKSLFGKIGRPHLTRALSELSKDQNPRIKLIGTPGNDKTKIRILN